jgi:hypothetical protein
MTQTNTYRTGNKLKILLVAIALSFPCIHAQRALEYWRAAKEGNTEAQLNLALCYYMGEGGAPKDGNTALYWFEKALAGRERTRATAEAIMNNLRKEGYSSSRANPASPAAPVRRTEPARTENPRPAANVAPGQKYVNWMEPLIEHNVISDGRKGMNIHTTFTLGNMSRRMLKCAAIFRLKDGPILKATDSEYSSGKGELSVSKNIVPKSENEIFNDVILFIPYDEFKLKNGKKHDLVCGVALYGRVGDSDKWECYVSNDLSFWIKQ